MTQHPSYCPILTKFFGKRNLKFNFEAYPMENFSLTVLWYLI